VTLPEMTAPVSRENAKMFWIRMAVTLVAGIVALVVVILGKRPVDIGKLGSVSDRWIAEHHRVDSV
jgi:hypothetical protein